MQRRLTSIAAAMLLAGTAFSAHAAKDVMVAVASTFTTTDPYDANDTLQTFSSASYSLNKPERESELNWNASWPTTSRPVA